jgi:hypothetical protein
MEKLSLICDRQKVSSMFGARKNGLPNRKLGPNPTPVSAGTFDCTAARGRTSRRYVKCASFTFVAEIELNKLTLKRWIFVKSPSMPFAELP